MKKKLKSNLFIGVLSGTSADSIDAGLFKIDKKISFLKLFDPTGDMEKDIKEMKAYFKRAD